jgi:hypothetical protein
MTAAWDETKDDMGDEVIKFTSADKGIWNIDNDYEDDGDGVEWDGIDEDSNSGSIEMWAISPKIKLFRDADGNGICDIGESNKIVRVGIENWLINNDGEVMNIDKLLGLKSSINPFEALRNIAMENALMVRDSEDIGLIANHSYTPVEYENIRKEFNNGNAFFKYNMDNILTPDFAIPIIEKVAADAASDL